MKHKLQVVLVSKTRFALYERKPFVVYRRQGMFIIDFDKWRKIQGGLMSFETFLSTSQDRQVSFAFVESVVLTDMEKVSILFVMAVDPTIISPPFANIQYDSCFQNEAEILFSIHTVFRIDAAKTMNECGRSFQVYLTMTVDDDAQLRILTEKFDDEVQHATGWNGIELLFLQVGALDKGEQLYQSLLGPHLEPRWCGSFQLSVVLHQDWTRWLHKSS